MDKEEMCMDLYEGKEIDIDYHVDPTGEYESFNLHIHGFLSISLDREDFKELCNAVFISKTKLDEKEKRK